MWKPQAALDDVVEFVEIDAEFNISVYVLLKVKEVFQNDAVSATKFTGAFRSTRSIALCTTLW